jgi:AbiV family abortive infection protein
MAEPNQPLKPGILEDRFARLGLANTRSLLRSADALARVLHYGHGLALVSLALEELETAHAYRLVADGIATFDPDEARALQFIDKRALLMHTPKLILLGERMLTFFYMRQTAKVIRRIRGYKPTPEEVMSVMMGGDAKLSPEVKKVLDSPDVVREGRAIKEDLHKLKDLKNRGLYVFEGRGASPTPQVSPSRSFVTTEISRTSSCRFSRKPQRMATRSPSRRACVSLTRPTERPTRDWKAR